MLFFRIISHLLPDARAWRVTIDKQLRQFFEGLAAGAADPSKVFFDLVWRDIDPEYTRELTAWETQFGLPNTVTVEQERRDRLAATWKALGGQDPRYIQDTLQAAGFPVYVHEWWVPGTEPTPGTKAAATARDPNLYLNAGGTALQYLSADGAPDMQDGDAIAQDGAATGPSGYPLVSKILVPTVTVLGDGSAGMVDGGPLAQDGSIFTSYAEKLYAVPADPTKYPYFLYIGGATFPDHAVVSSARRNEFETLCLKICPSQQWLGILVDYT